MESKEIKVLDKGLVRLVDVMGNDSSIVQAARVSYGAGTKTPSDDRTLIRYMMRNKHTSVFEQVIVKLHVKAPIFVFRQWHRHRTFSFNELSLRYSEAKDEFYLPEDSVFTKQNPNNKQGGTDEKITLHDCGNADAWVDAGYGTHFYDTAESQWKWSDKFKNQQMLARAEYERWIGTGVRKELARINLPVSQYSEMYATVDLHNLFHFLKLRLDTHAQYEIRVYAEAVYELIKPIFPMACEAFEDYVLNSVTLSAKEAECLGRIVSFQLSGFSGQGCLRESCLKDGSILNKFLPNKREQQEFLEKLKKLSLENL